MDILEYDGIFLEYSKKNITTHGGVKFNQAGGWEVNFVRLKGSVKSY